MSSLEQIILVMPYIPIREYNIQLSDYTLEDYKLEITTEIKAFDSTFIIYPPYEFEPTTGELSGQFQCGTLRERGNYKNNEVELIIQDDLVQGNYSFEDYELDSYRIINPENLSVTIELLLGLFYSPNNEVWQTKTFRQSDYLYGGLLSSEDKTKLNSIGLSEITDSISSDEFAGVIGAIEYNTDYNYELLAIYSDQGTTELEIDKSNFFLSKNINSPYSNALIINSINAYDAPALTWKVRISKKIGMDGYLNINKSEQYLQPNTDYVLYDENGVAFNFEYKQEINNITIYDSNDNIIEQDDIYIKCLHDGNSWKIYISTTDDDTRICRIKFKSNRVAREHIVFGGSFNDTNDTSWNITDVFGRMVEE